MTNFVSTYNFMDLLKDKGFAPQTDVNVQDNAQGMESILNGFSGMLSSKIELTTPDYDFMDLMHDKGFVPEPSNDNVLSEEVA